MPPETWPTILAQSSPPAARPPWATETWSLYGAFVVLLLLGAVAVYGVRAHRLRRRVWELEERLRERTLQLGAADGQLKLQATGDGVTGLATHAQFQDALRLEWRRALRERLPLSLILIDIDFFKDYNDRFGHEAGDRCLQRIGQALKSVVGRAGDLVARYGGEEFAVILAGTEASGAFQVARKVHAAIDALGLPNPDAPGGRLTVSLGVATATPVLDSTWEELALMTAANRALTQAKQGGRNRVVVAEG